MHERDQVSNPTIVYPSLIKALEDKLFIFFLVGLCSSVSISQLFRAWRGATNVALWQLFVHMGADGIREPDGQCQPCGLDVDQLRLVW